MALRTLALFTTLISINAFAEPLVVSDTPVKPISPYLMKAYEVCPEAPRKLEELPTGDYILPRERADRLACKQSVCEVYVRNVEDSMTKPDAPMVMKVVGVVAAGLVIGFTAGYATALLKK